MLPVTFGLQGRVDDTGSDHTDLNGYFLVRKAKVFLKKTGLRANNTPAKFRLLSYLKGRLNS